MKSFIFCFLFLLASNHSLANFDSKGKRTRTSQGDYQPSKARDLLSFSYNKPYVVATDLYANLEAQVLANIAKSTARFRGPTIRKFYLGQRLHILKRTNALKLTASEQSENFHDIGYTETIEEYERTGPLYIKTWRSNYLIIQIIFSSLTKQKNQRARLVLTRINHPKLFSLPPIPKEST